MTRFNLQDYYILSSILSGGRLLITFQNSLDIHDRQVLEINEIAGFIVQRTSDEIMILRIDDGGGSYPMDLSIRLRRPEIASYSQAFFCTDAKEVNFSFRACAKSIVFREWEENDHWLK